MYIYIHANTVSAKTQQTYTRVYPLLLGFFSFCHGLMELFFPGAIYTYGNLYSRIIDYSTGHDQGRFSYSSKHTKTAESVSMEASCLREISWCARKHTKYKHLFKSLHFHL